MSCEAMEGIGTAREGKGVRGVGWERASTLLSALTEVGVLGKVMPVMMAKDVAHKQVYAMSCLSDVIRHICCLQD